MEKRENFEKKEIGFCETLHLPFSSNRKKILLPEIADTKINPSYDYISAKTFNFSNGFLIWYFFCPPLIKKY